MQDEQPQFSHDQVISVFSSTKTFRLSLISPEVGLSGELDMLVETEDELIPIDFKYAKKAGTHFKLQLAAYGRLLQAPPTTKVKRGFLYLIPKRQAVQVKFTQSLNQKLDEALKTMQAITHDQKIPPPTPRRARCTDCEFRRFCNDV